jgi:hypothetical protein
MGEASAAGGGGGERASFEQASGENFSNEGKAGGDGADEAFDDVSVEDIKDEEEII